MRIQLPAMSYVDIEPIQSIRGDADHIWFYLGSAVPRKLLDKMAKDICDRTPGYEYAHIRKAMSDLGAAAKARYMACPGCNDEKAQPEDNLCISCQMKVASLADGLKKENKTIRNAVFARLDKC